jgi:hypothetical protein
MQKYNKVIQLPDNLNNQYTVRAINLSIVKRKKTFRLYTTDGMVIKRNFKM